MIYRNSDPALDAAYRVVGRQARREAWHAEVLEARLDYWQGTVAARERGTVMVDGGPWSPAGTKSITLAEDLAHYVWESDDPQALLVAILAGDERKVLDAYALARAEDEADREIDRGEAEACQEYDNERERRRYDVDAIEWAGGGR